MPSHQKLTHWLLIALLLSAAASSVLGPSVVARASARQEAIPLYGLFETAFQVPGSYTNPYDPQQIDVTAQFIAPSGESMQVPAFYMRPYEQTCTADCRAEQLSPSGDPEWRVRFSPNEIGTWVYTIQARAGETVTEVTSGVFEVASSSSPGTIHVGSNPRYFAFDSGAPYFPIGENLGWSWDEEGGIFAYEHWLDSLSAAGANYARVNIDVPWFIGLDWPGPAGNYDEAQPAAWRLDTILQLAEEKGIYLQVVLLWNQAYTDSPAPPVELPDNAQQRPDLNIDWDNNPYNVANGGPLDGPSALFFDETARTLLHQRLRYVVARWGYSSHIFAWEVVDAVDGIIGYTPARAQIWLSDAVAYLRQTDPYHHLITAGARQPDTPISELAPLDFIETRYYQSRPQDESADQVAGTLNALSRISANQPALLNEFSLNPWYQPTADDPTGVHVRNTIWAAALSGSAGSAMTWWWDSYIDRENLYSIFTPLALFCQDIPWNSPGLQPTSPSLSASDPGIYSPLRVNDFNREFLAESPPDTIYRLTTDGVVPPTAQLSAYLYGAANPERSRPQTLMIAPPVDTELRIGVLNVSPNASAVLVVTIDGLEASRVEFSPNTANIQVTIPLSAGEHTVILDNLGQDWLQLDYLEIGAYSAPARVVALADRTLGVAAAWIQHRDYTWDRVASGETAQALTFSLGFSNMPAGSYRVSYWDTLTGTVIGEETITLDNPGTLSLLLPPLTTQLAVHAALFSGR